MMISTVWAFVQKVLAFLPEDIKSQLRSKLERRWRTLNPVNPARDYALALRKGADAFIANVVSTIPDDGDQDKALQGFVDAQRSNATALGDAYAGYVPLDLAVERAKKLHGDTQPPAKEVSDARAARKAYINKLDGAIASLLLSGKVE